MYANAGPQRGLGCCQRKPLGDVWTSLDNAAATVVDWASVPWNLISGGQLTNMQRNALLLQGQDQIFAVADTPLAQSDPSIQAAARAAAIRNSGALPLNQQSVQALAPPTNSDIYLSLLNTGLGVQPNKPATANYGLWILAGLGLAIFAVSR